MDRWIDGEDQRRRKTSPRALDKIQQNARGKSSTALSVHPSPPPAFFYLGPASVSEIDRLG